MWSLDGSERLCVSKTPLILHPPIYGMLAWYIKAFSFEDNSCPSRETCVILGSMYNGISEFVRLWAFKRAVRAFSTLRHIIVVAARALVVVNGCQSSSSAAALAHRKEPPMKGDMGQENRYALDANADTIGAIRVRRGLCPLRRACSRMAVPARKVSSPRPHASILQLKRWRGAPKAKRLTSSNPPLAARRRVVMPGLAVCEMPRTNCERLSPYHCDIAMGEQVHLSLAAKLRPHNSGFTRPGGRG